MTSRNIPITACLAFISIGELGLGIYHTTIAITYPSMYTGPQNMAGGSVRIRIYV